MEPNGIEAPRAVPTDPSLGHPPVAFFGGVGGSFARAHRATLRRYEAIPPFQDRGGARKWRPSSPRIAPGCRVIDGLFPHCAAQCAGYSALCGAAHPAYRETLLALRGRSRLLP